MQTFTETMLRNMTVLDWAVVVLISAICVGVGLSFTRSTRQAGQEGYFTANRSLSWWAVGISNSATYQSGLGAFVMLIFIHGLSGNWLWWVQWIIWMPLVAIIWSRMWRRMGIVTTAELISLRYGGRYAKFARKLFAFYMFILAILVISYITGFFARTVYPVIELEIWMIIAFFGTITVLYTMFGGLKGSVMVAVVQLVIMIAGSLAFLFLVIPEFGGWSEILSRVQENRGAALSLAPVTDAMAGGAENVRGPWDKWLATAVFVILGLFFAGSPTAGEGMTAQRFMAARNERHAIGGQLFNAFIALSLRVVPLIGLGIIALSVFWHSDFGPMPEGYQMLDDPAYAWGALLVRANLPNGLVGLLIATEIAAFMSTLSALINWGSSFVVNDFYKDLVPHADRKQEVWASRLTTLFMAVVAAVVAIFFVDNMMSWFIFINATVIIFWLPLAWFRFFWSRFNVWGEMTATALGLPLAIWVWFPLGGLGLNMQTAPYWQGLGLLFTVAVIVQVLATLLTRPESEATLVEFYKRCRPMVGWTHYRRTVKLPPNRDPSPARLIFDSFLGMACCLGLVEATSSIFVQNWLVFGISSLGTVVFGAWLLRRCFGGPEDPQALEPEAVEQPVGRVS
jgi:solute:Na+ symporter, SSS family